MKTVGESQGNEAQPESGSWRAQNGKGRSDPIEKLKRKRQCSKRGKRGLRAVEKRPSVRGS